MSCKERGMSMNNNKSMIVYKKGFFTKIGNFFKNLFSKHNEENVNEEMLYKASEQSKTQNEQDNMHFIEKIKINDNKIFDVAKRKEFLDEINANAEALEMLSIDRLKKLEQYYDEIIRQNNAKIKRLRESA